MKKVFLSLILMLLSVSVSASDKTFRETIDLKGVWQFCLDPKSTVMPDDNFTEKITLPGTTDTNSKGERTIKKDETKHLTRLFSYKGKAWYKKVIEIPETWKNKQISLFLERTKPAQIYVDGKFAGKSNDISTPQTYEITSFLTSGRHVIAIMVDNGSGVPEQLYSSSHAYTEDTQTNWNGIIGSIKIEAVNYLHISDIKVYPNTKDNNVAIKIDVGGEISLKNSIVLELSTLTDSTGNNVIRMKLNPHKGNNILIDDIVMNLPDNKQWSEFHPYLYRLKVKIPNYDESSVDFGMVNFLAKGDKFTVNGHTTFLRGKHDACVFPIIAHTPMDVETWRNYFQTLKTYGINHCRFHSWCPPEACFKAADIEGIYLQPELPFWGDFNKKDTCLMQFLKKEGLNILRTYGNHPSFVMFALGNELWGDIKAMKQFTDCFRKTDSRHLYTFGSNFYLGYKPVDSSMDYFTTCRLGGEEKDRFNTHTRGSFSFADAYDGGYINHCYPNTTMDFSEALKTCKLPVISHETGQFQIYPDYNEIKKYKGVLYPYNMEVFRKRLENAGMASQAADFHMASGLWAVELYKADIEMDLRSSGLAGFHLLDLQDYPGQGSAYVGILDAFMDSKNLIKPKAFRQFCSPVVPLLLLQKYCFTNNEKVSGIVKIANYSETPLKNKTLSWRITGADGTLREGNIIIPNDSLGLFYVGNIATDMKNINKAERLNLSLSIDGTDYSNTYPLWVYPDNSDIKSYCKNIVITDTITDNIEKRLVKGANVLFMPEFMTNTVGGLFQTDYWNYRMFKTICENNKQPVSPGTLGLLTNPQHHLFDLFPTDCHTNWQWFPMIKASHPFILDNMPDAFQPIVQVVDNIERNHKLGLIFEMNVGIGKLLICMTPLNKLTQYPEARQLFLSILEYMNSAYFKPATKLSIGEIENLFNTKVQDEKIGELNNISYQ